MIRAISILAAIIPVFIEQPAPAPGGIAKSDVEDRLAVMKNAASRYDFRAGERNSESVLVSEPLLRWTNPVAQEEDAGLFLWTRQGRPEAAAQFFVRKNLWMHEFQSLSERPFAVEWENRTIWSPRQAGVVFHPDSTAPTPDGDAAHRLRQMRTIAASFSASVEFQYDRDSHYELRLLSRPLHRYGKAGGPVVDGTLWAFVQGTNPEVLLLVEARPEPDSRMKWHYAFGAMTSYPAEARRNGKPVWQVDRQPIPTPNIEGSYLFRYDVPTANR